MGHDARRQGQRQEGPAAWPAVLVVAPASPGATADAFTLIECGEAKPSRQWLRAAQLARACVDLAGDWRNRPLSAACCPRRCAIAADASAIFTVSGAGADVLEPEHGVAAIGSGGQYALAVAPGC